MSAVAVAAAVVGAGASIYGANKAADTMQGAAGQANALENQMYYQTRSDQGPYRESGYNALNAYNRLMGLGQVDTQSALAANQQALGPQGLRPQPEMVGKKQLYTDGDGNGFIIAEYGENKGQVIPTGKKYPQYAIAKPAAAAPGASNAAAPASGEDRYGGFYASPGYQFRMDEGSRAYDRSAAARGMLLSGAQVKAQTRYGQGVASDEFGSYANRLAALAGIGQTATNAVGAAGQNYAQGAGNAMMEGGMARASGYLGTANAIGSIAGGVMQAAPYMGQPRQTNNLKAYDNSWNNRAIAAGVS